MNKYYFVSLEIQDGEHEYTIPRLMVTATDADPILIGDVCASEFFGNDTTADEDDESTYWDGEEQLVSVTSSTVKEITEQEYEVLNRYL